MLKQHNTMSALTPSNLLKQRRARGWLDDNTSDWGQTPDEKPTFYAYVHGYDEPVHADSIIQLCLEGTELLGDNFIL